MDYVRTFTPTSEGIPYFVSKNRLPKIIQKINIHFLCFYPKFICDIDNE